jgi:AraC-like DNA-binding protein
MKAITVTDAKAVDLLPIYLLHAGMNHRQEPRNRPSGADFYQFLYVVSGEGVFESEGKRLLISEGDTVFSAAAVPTYYYARGESFSTGWITFRGAQAEPILTYLSAERVAVLKNENVKAQIQELCKRAKHCESPAMLSQGVYRLLVTFFTALNEARKAPKLVAAKQYIDLHYERDLSVLEIADTVGISESLLFRMFREEEKCTPIDYLRSVRIRAARNLLIGSESMKIAEIATAVGFSDVSYFCKVFRIETGLTPRAYRLKYRS